jgi:dephospho-CoA kinase
MKKHPYVLGLTGSIGTGKTTIAGFFTQAGIPVWDADATVHRLYRSDPDALAGIGNLLPGAVLRGFVDRKVLKTAIEKDGTLLEKIEDIIHPLVAHDREKFLKEVCADGEKLVVLDIPLLFESGAQKDCDGVLVATASLPQQRRRVMARPGMTEKTFEMILSKQMPDSQKRQLADFVIESEDYSSTQSAVLSLIDRLIRGRRTHA